MVMFAPVVVASCAFGQEQVDVTFDSPHGDRWNYPFNPTPGARPTASVFGNDAGSPLFDNRDGQMTLLWNTDPAVPGGRVRNAYFVQSCRVILEYSSDLSIAYDFTTDPWQNFVDESDRNYIPDADPGQPIEIFGTGFRNGYSLASWEEDAPYTVKGMSLLDPGVRNAYALGFNDVGQFVDVSNSVREEWSPDPFATGFIEGLGAGELIPVGSQLIFDLAIDNPLVQGYLQQSVSDGRLSLSVTSLAEVVEQGSVFPAFYCKESPLVEVGAAAAAHLELSVLLFECAIGDLDCDGVVGAVDLGILLGAWGDTDTPYDLDGDGIVDASDLAILLGAWG